MTEGPTINDEGQPVSSPAHPAEPDASGKRDTADAGKDVSAAAATAPRDNADREDTALLVRIATGDRKALTELYGRYFHPLQRFIYRITGDLDLAQEGINDVMMVVWTKAGTFSGRSRVSTWIMGIAYKKGLKLSHKATRWTSRFKAADWSEAVEPIAGSSGHTDEIVRRDLLEQALGSLSPKHRAVVELTYFQGHSYEEIAAIVKCPVNTVKTRMFHARAKLKELIPAMARDELK